MPFWGRGREEEKPAPRHLPLPTGPYAVGSQVHPRRQIFLKVQGSIPAFCSGQQERPLLPEVRRRKNWLKSWYRYKWKRFRIRYVDFVRRQVSVGRNVQILPSYRARVKRCGQFLGFSVRYPLKMLTTFIRYRDIVVTVEEANFGHISQKNKL